MRQSGFCAAVRGGLKKASDEPPPRQIWLLQRKTSKVGDGLAKTTGWIRRTLLKRRNVKMLAGVSYEKIDDAGVRVAHDGGLRVQKRHAGIVDPPVQSHTPIHDGSNAHE